ERRESDEGMVGNNGSFTFDFMKKVEWRELTTLEIKEGSEEIWLETNEKIFRGKREKKKRK
ncbi:hypothetical protein ABN262_23435, partial [Citrobacter youngae]|uniref:hypothetical protein n=1 Tax=Citrobacter youngae TaxID=133448 RepID=UPI0032DBDE55